MLILCFVELKLIVHQHSLGSTGVLWQSSLPMCCSQQLQLLPPVAAEHGTLRTASAIVCQGAYRLWSRPLHMSCGPTRQMHLCLSCQPPAHSANVWQQSLHVTSQVVFTVFTMAAAGEAALILYMITVTNEAAVLPQESDRLLHALEWHFIVQIYSYMF